MIRLLSFVERVNVRSERPDSKDLDEDWHSDVMSSQDETDSEESPSVDLVPQSTKTITVKKLSVKSHKPLPAAKRLRLTADEDEPTNDTQLDPQQLLYYLKQTNSIVSSLKKQQEQTAVSFDRSEKFLKILCSNQKKIAKTMIKRRIPINLEQDESASEMNDQATAMLIRYAMEEEN
ncbi:unnamed protein product [Didymodactylos carnosus]|uniref:Uncharacterized protein n=1 Tax=Didymodactylos carnosus TaxID=1234261 RepID=A0A8S2KHG2_9BILA|nr:unnamed protein product [Didymodactylos carnosus]CAF3851991.1 unnamed protein product [Didymodactylos carnosus]